MLKCPICGGRIREEHTVLTNYKKLVCIETKCFYKTLSGIEKPCGYKEYVRIHEHNPSRHNTGVLNS